MLTGLIEWLGTPEQAELRRAFTVWIKRVLLPVRLPGVALPEVGDLQEVRSMLAERVIEWTQEWKQQGLQEGRREGLQQGLVESARTSVLDVLETRFGRVPLTIQATVNRLDDPGLLRALHKQAILASSLAEFERVLLSYCVI